MSDLNKDANSIEVEVVQENNTNTSVSIESAVPRSFDLMEGTAVKPENAVVSPGPEPAQAPVSVQDPSASVQLFTCTTGRDYFSNGGFFSDIQKYALYDGRGTGYINQDQKNDFMPGLYVFGAISSLGKTTFSWQLSDQQAAMGNHVMYFAMEQSKLELYAKSVSRISFQKYNDDVMNNGHSNLPCYTSMDIRKCRADHNQLKSIIDDYDQTIGDRVHVYEGMFQSTIEDIGRAILGFINKMGVTPVIIIDYLQAIAPSIINGRTIETKTNVDHIIMTLKNLQLQFDLTIILISSLNRSNYLLPVDFESFKESGGIEYTADVVWGLQLHVVSLPGFSRHIDTQTGKIGKEKNIKEKREMVRIAKAASPRRLEMISLKNRFGESGYSIFFDYYPAYETMIALDSSGHPM